MTQHYVFLCLDNTEKECLKRKIFGLSRKYLPIVSKIRKGDKLFLYNSDSDNLYGIFEAASDGADNIDPRAWGGRYPAQVKVSIDFEQLKEISGASNVFPFLRRNPVELTKEQAEMLLKKFETAPVIGEPIYEEHTIPNIEKLFAAFLDKQEIPYVRTSQETEDFSNVLRKMKAKRPDFLILAKGQQIFVEVKPNLIQYEVPQIFVDVDEVNKLNQFQLQTGVETIILFPLDHHGTAWKPLRPSWIVANGIKRKVQDREVFVINVRKTEKIKLPFNLET